MNVNTNVESLRKKLIENNYTNIGEYEEFSKRLEKEGNRKKVYEVAKGLGLKNDYNSFSELLGYPIVQIEQEPKDTISTETPIKTPVDTISTEIKTDTIPTETPTPVEVENPYASMSDEELNTSLDVMRKGIESKSQEFDANNPIEKPSTPQGTPYGGYVMQGAMAIQDAQARDNAKAKKEYLAEDYSKLVNSGEFKEYQKREREKIEAELKKLDELDNKIARENSDANIISGKYAGAGEIGLNRYARQLYEKALKTLDAPSEYDESWWLANVGRGALDRATDADLYSLGINEILRNSALVPIARKVEEVKGKLDSKLESGKLSKEDAVKIMEDSFTESEKALINAYRYNEEVSQKRKDDLSYGYRSGQGIVDTGAFMMDYFLTGGISSGAKNAVKGGVKKVLKNKAGDVIGGALGTTAETAVRTAVLPHTYGMVTNEMLNIDENTGKLNSTARAFALGMSEAFLTNLSETTGGIIPSTTKAILKNKGIVKLSSQLLEKMGKTGEKLTNLKSKYDKSKFKQLSEQLKKAGWHGTIDEWFEELDNAAFMYARGGVRNMAGDKGAEGDLSQLPEFFTAENQKVLIPTLLAPTAVKGAVTLPSDRWDGKVESVGNEKVSNDKLATITLDGKEVTGRVSGKYEVSEDGQTKGFPVFTYVDGLGSVVTTPLNQENLENITYLSELTPESEGDVVDTDLSKYIDENENPTQEGSKRGVHSIFNNNIIIKTSEGHLIPLTRSQALSYLNGLEQIEQQENEQANQSLSQEERDFVESLEDEREEAEIPTETPIETPIEEPTETSAEETPVEETPSVESEEVASEEEVETPIEVNEEELNLETFTPKTILDVLDDDGMPTEFGKKIGVQSFEDGIYQVYNANIDMEYSLDEGRMKALVELENQREKNAIDKRNREKKQAVIDAVKAERKAKEDAKKKVKEYATEEPKVESVAEETPTENPFFELFRVAEDNEIPLENIIKENEKEVEKLKKAFEKNFNSENARKLTEKKKELEGIKSAYAEYQALNKPTEQVEGVPVAEEKQVETPVVEEKVNAEVVENPLENQEESSNFTEQINTENNETTNEFRRIQDESGRISDEERRLFREGERKVSTEFRERIARVLGRWVEYRNNSNGDSTWILTNPKTGEEIKVYKVEGSLFRECFEVCHPYLERGDQVDLHDQEFYDNGFGFISEDGLAGFFITNEGNAVSGYSLQDVNAKGKGFFATIAPLMKQFATHADCFKTKRQDLPSFYEKVFGFRTASVLDFNYDIIAEEKGKEYADWFIETYGEAPVYFMVMPKGEQTIESKHFNKDQYDEAFNYQQSQINETSNEEIPSSEVTIDKFFNETPQTANELTNFKAFANNNIDELSNDISSIVEERKSKNEGYKINGKSTKLGSFKSTQDIEALASGSNSNPISRWYNAAIEQQGKNIASAPNSEVRSLHVSQLESLESEYRRIKELAKEINKYNSRLSDLKDIKFKEGTEAERTTNFMPVNTDTYFDTMYKKGTKTKRIRLKGFESKDGKVISVYDVYGSDKELKLTEEEKTEFTSPMVELYTKEGFIRYVQVSSTEEISGSYVSTFAEDGSNVGKAPLTELYTDAETKTPLKERGKERHDNTKDTPEEIIEKTLRRISNKHKDESELNKTIIAINELEAKIKQTEEADIAYGRQTGEVGVNEYLVNLKKALDILQDRKDAMNNSIAEEELQKIEDREPTDEELNEIEQSIAENELKEGEELYKAAIEKIQAEADALDFSELLSVLSAEQRELFDNLDTLDKKYLAKLNGFTSAQIRFLEGNMEDRGFYRDQIDRAEKKLGKIDYANIPLSLINDEDYKVIFNLVNEEIPKAKGKIRKETLINRHIAMARQLGEEVKYKPIKKHITDEEILNNQLLLRPIMHWLKGTGVKFHTTKKDFLEALSSGGKIGFFKTNKGIIYGFVKDGEIYLDPEELNPQTPIHEYSHLWLNAIRKVNKKLWERGVELAKQLPEWVELQQNSAYSFENEEELAEEVLSTYIGKNGTAQLEALVQRGDVPITIVQRIRKWISDVWNTLKGILDEWTDQDLSELTVDKLSAMAIRDLSEMTNVSEINDEMTSRNIVEGTYINEYEEMRSDFIAEIEKMKTEGNMSQYSIAKDKLNRIVRFAKERLDKKSELTKKEFSKIVNEINKSITVYKNNFTGEVNDRAIDRTADQLMNQLVKIDKLMSEVLEKQVDAEQSKVEDILHRAVEGLQKEKIKKGGMMTEYYAQSILDARKEFSLEEESYENLIVEIDDRIATIRDGEITNESISELYALEAHKELLKVQETQQMIDNANLTLEDYRSHKNELEEDRKKAKDEEVRKRMTKAINTLRENISLLETRLSAMKLEKVEHKRAYLMKCKEIVYSGRADYLNKVRQKEYENKKFLDEAIKEVKSGEVEDKIKSKPNKYTKILKSALDSLEMTIREVSVNIRDGRGSIYKRFIRSVSDARNKTIETLQEEGDIINGVISNIFGYEYGKWYNVTKKARRSVESPIERLTQQSNNEVFGTITQTVKDLENGIEVEKEIEYSITNGTAMYIYMSAKQKEGYSALLKDGFTKEEIERISENLDVRYKQFADWIQEEYMPKLYERYDKKYYDRYFIHLPRVENYFPLKTMEAANRQEILANTGDEATQFNAKTTVDNLFHRTGGSQIDIRNHNNNPNAISILTNYVTRMEHWNQFVDIQNDANILLNSAHFRDNILRQSDGATKWNSFRIALIETVNEVDKGDRDFITGIVNAYMIGKIGLKPWNAFKQMTSYPAFLAYATNKYVFYNLIKNLNPLNAFAQRNRAFRLFPCIKDRYYNSAMGHEMLSTEYNTDSYWWNKVNQWFSNTAIFMNRTVDIITVSKGALAVYDGMKRQYIESGMSEAEADSEARIDAMIAYKATQQENTPEFLGSIQREHSTASSVAKAFNNSSFAFARLLYIESLIALKNLDRVNNPRMVELEVERVMKAHPEYSREQAETKANELMDKQIRNSFQTLSAVGGGQLFFYLASAPSVLLNILSSDDDDNEKGWIAFLMILLRVGIVTPLGGIPFLGAISDSVLTGNFKYYDVLSILPDSDLVMKGIERFNNADTIGKKAAAIVGTIIEVLPLKITGNTMYRMFDGIYNIIQNGDITAADVANILSMPPSEVQELIRHGYGDEESYINSYGWLDHLIERLD